MSKLEEAQEILKALGLPPAQYNEMAALTFLAVCNIKENDHWSNATRQSLGVTKGIMSFVNEHYGKSYAPNTRETFRRHVLHQFVQARVVDYNPDKPDLPVNSPNAHYALTNEVLEVIKSYKTKNWEKTIENFIATVGKLSEVYLKGRELNQIPVTLQNGETIKLSAGKHNEVQAAIVEQFAPRFANGGTLLYLGDTAKKDLFVDEKSLKDLGIPIDQHSKLPDVVIYDIKRNWLFLIEAVTSHGPVSPKRLLELEEFLKNCKAGKVYVTAFPDMAEFKKHSNNIAWETEVWLMEVPDHMIHFNGDRFIGPR
ncbi:MAG: restriction endonuclease [Bacteroidetes bacterium GWF2_42_66]|nr:MAG: restriction endonuclease [Bacteroidetes bacterium GWA2_42_15]OFY01841.1 MAG: restriction endonuclease [Bacteroidetes bacterium GWE2_42_39]OFY44864.1 MAG: restriction endonuclease [Bacteroidetes bacterium GWF2_42_66]HBL75991.1 restriction endonuclease [Prolixibacteraceae bacterium]HCR89963.1 restriction endonuclease [Prolixibacteraceae bacterium]